MLTLLKPSITFHSRVRPPTFSGICRATRIQTLACVSTLLEFRISNTPHVLRDLPRDAHSGYARGTVQKMNSAASVPSVLVSVSFMARRATHTHGHTKARTRTRTLTRRGALGLSVSLSLSLSLSLSRSVSPSLSNASRHPSRATTANGTNRSINQSIHELTEIMRPPPPPPTRARLGEEVLGRLNY